MKRVPVHYTFKVRVWYFREKVIHFIVLLFWCIVLFCFLLKTVETLLNRCVCAESLTFSLLCSLEASHLHFLYYVV